MAAIEKLETSARPVGSSELILCRLKAAGKVVADSRRLALGLRSASLTLILPELGELRTRRGTAGRAERDPKPKFTQLKDGR
jgi:hypothetical protein